MANQSSVFFDAQRKDSGSPPRILLTSTCRPFGRKYGDAPSVGYELLHRQVTRAQGLFSPRALHLHFSLEYIAENLDAPAVVLQYPTRAELIKELKKGYDYVGVSFIMALFHKMKDAAALIRKYSPNSKIVLGGYGTVLKDEVLRPYADAICREEGVAFFRKLLGEPPLPIPYRHPLIVSRLKLLSLPVSKTGMIFAGLGCANGCDFCCTSHFFGRRHLKLLPDGKDIYGVVERYLDIDPNMSFVVLDEDFLLNKRRAMEFRDCVMKGGKAVSIFVFSSIRAISQYKPTEILEMGIDGFWIGYEGTKSGFPKQNGRPPEELFPDLRAHGITILASMIVGFDYQNKEVVARELEGLMKLKPSLAQFLIYGPTPGTPFYERVMSQNLLQDGLIADPERYYRTCDGFTTMIKHPTLKPSEIEDLQRWCFKEDFRRLGPSVFRVIEVWLNGYEKLKDSPSPILRIKAARFAREARHAYPVFLSGRLFGPTREARRRIGELQKRAWSLLGRPAILERIMSAGAVLAAAWTWVSLRIPALQHPRLTRTAYRMPEKGRGMSALWENLPKKLSIPGLSAVVAFERRRKRVWLRLEGALEGAHAEALGAQIGDALSRTKNKLVLDLKRLKWKEGSLSPVLDEKLKEHRSRVRLLLPKLSSAHPELLLLAKLFRVHNV